MSKIYSLLVIGTALTQQQRDNINIALQDSGPNTDSDPCNNVHWRWSTDGQQLIVEANFVTNPTKAQFVTFIANRTGLASATVNANLTASYFGGINATYPVSLAAVIAFLQANAAAWGE